MPAGAKQHFESSNIVVRQLNNVLKFLIPRGAAVGGKGVHRPSDPSHAETLSFETF